MVTRESFDTEQLEWLKKQLELRRQVNKFISVRLYGNVDSWLVDDEHICAFVTEYMGQVIDELRDNLSKENFEKVRLFIKEADTVNDNMC
jgi:hypothetical protein